uniref:Uncharacterized protein LOC114324448 n=1 Tax=Diabrotica virgifera virgifera TaxID=50390 RepID=A0A6P7EZS8_DIAVI
MIRREPTRIVSPYPDYLRKLISARNLLRFEMDATIDKNKLKVKGVELRILSSAVEIELRYFNEKLRHRGHKMLMPMKNNLPKFLHIAFEENVKQRMIHKLSGNKLALVKFEATKQVIPKLIAINEEKNRTLQSEKTGSILY